MELRSQRDLNFANHSNKYALAVMGELDRKMNKMKKDIPSDGRPRDFRFFLRTLSKVKAS